MRSKFLVISASAIAIAAPLQAAENEDTTAPVVTSSAAAATADVPEEDPIIVEGERSSYGASAITTATKTRTDVRNIPQALTVITKAQIDDQQMRSIAELLTFVPGASFENGEGHRDQIIMRGNNTTADFFVDGLRDDVQYFRDFYNVSRVEVLKGPNAMIFGRGGGGGIVNRVLKRPTFNPYRALDVASSDLGGFRVAGDLEHPIGEAVAVRFNGLFEDGESFRRHVEMERLGINPTVAAYLGENTRLDIGYEYFRDRRTVDRGVPSVTDPVGTSEPLKGFDKVFFGDPDDSRARTDVHLLNAAIEHQFSDELTIRNRAIYGDYDKFYQNIYPSNLDEATNEVVLRAYNNGTKRENLISQTDLVWDGQLGSVDQTLLVGAEFGRQTSRNRRMTGSFIGSDRVPLADPTVDATVIFAPSASDANSRTKATIAAFYIQQQLRPASWIEIVAGLRFDRFRLEVDDFRAAGGSFARTDNLWSPRVGLILKPTDNLSLYASFSRSYLPQSGDQFSGLSITTAALKPEKFDNYELGAKWEPIPGLLATAAIYQLDRTNTRAADPLNPGNVVLTGAQRSRGIELGLERSITHKLQISAGYAYTEAEITETTASAPEGRKVPYVPKHSFSLWTKYDVNKSFALGLGLVSRSKSYASLSNAVKLPGYTRVDAAAYYTITRGVQARLNVENIFNADYFPSAHNDNNITPGAPRSAKLSVRVDF